MFWNLLFQCQKVFTDEQLWLNSLSCAKQNFYSCILPNTWTRQPVSVETSVDHATLRSLYSVYQTISAVDNYIQSYVGSSVDVSNCLHSGTSDCIVSESDDLYLLRKQLPWIGEMTGMLEDMAVSAARRWQDTMALSSDGDVANVSLDMEHFDKWVNATLLYCCFYNFFTWFSFQ